MSYATSSTQNQNDCNTLRAESVYHLKIWDSVMVRLPFNDQGKCVLPKMSTRDVHLVTPEEQQMTGDQRNAIALLTLGYPFLQQFLPHAENESHAVMLRHVFVFDQRYPELKGTFTVAQTDGKSCHCTRCNTDLSVKCAWRLAYHALISCTKVYMDPMICMKCGVKWSDLPRGCVDPNHFSLCMDPEEFNNRIEWIEELGEYAKDIPVETMYTNRFGISAKGYVGSPDDKFDKRNCSTMFCWTTNKLIGNYGKIPLPEGLKRDRLIEALNGLCRKMCQPRIPYPFLSLGYIPPEEVKPPRFLLLIDASFII